MKVSKVPLAILVSLLFVTSVLVACGGAPAVTKTPSPSVAPSTAPATAKATTPASTKTYNLKFSHYGEPAHSVAIMGLYFAKEVEKRTQGRVKTEALFSGPGALPRKYSNTLLLVLSTMHISTIPCTWRRCLSITLCRHHMRLRGQM